MKDLNKVCKEIKLISKPGRNKKNYYVKCELTNGSSTEMFCEQEFYDAIKVLKEIYGEPIKRKELVEELSEKSDTYYTCVLIELCDGTVFRFFPKRAFDIIVNALYSKFEQENKEKEKENVISKK